MLPPPRHRWKLPPDAYETSDRVAKFGLVLSEVSNVSGSNYEDFDIRSRSGEILDPPSGDVRWGFLLDEEMVRDPGTPPQSQPGVPLHIMAAVRINGHDYVRRDRTGCICKRNNARRKSICPGRAQVVNGHCRITASYTNECIAASLIEGEVVETLEEKVAINLELLQSQRGITVPSMVSLCKYLSYLSLDTHIVPPIEQVAGLDSHSKFQEAIFKP